MTADPMTTPPSPAPGSVYLVGAGPGNLGLITLRAVECLRQADVVLYDYLANPAALEHAAGDAELVCLGHHRTGRRLSPDEITALMLAEARKGRTVVRLKGGDPLIFGRTGDEADALRKAGIPFEIVPGITSGLAAAAYCEIPVTHHDHASAVALVTAREREEKTMSRLDHRALAEFPGTLVVYMGVQRAGAWCRQLIDNGKPPDTPVAIVRWCSWARQQTVRCTLETVPEVVGEHGIRPPAVFVIGTVVDRSPQLSWFTSRPLFNTRVLVAGSPAASQRLRDRLAALGADVITQPAVRITAPKDWTQVDAALDRIDEYDGLVFTSANGVDSLVRRLLDRGDDVRRLGRVKLVAAGAGTADQLTRYHLKADLGPGQLADDAGRGRFLLAGAGRGRSVVAEALQSAGAVVDRIAVYDRVDAEEPDPDVAAELSAGEIDWIALTSAVTAESLVRLYGDAVGRARLASISPMTTRALGALGYTPAVEASPHTTAALVDAILGATGER
jgi:uroporphyrinogen III methyltransferase/synthase